MLKYRNNIIYKSLQHHLNNYTSILRFKLKLSIGHTTTKMAGVGVGFGELTIGNGPNC